MITTVLIIALCLAQLPGLDTTEILATLSSTCTDSNCKTCWVKGTEEKCDECKEGYMFDYQTAKNDPTADKECHSESEFISRIAGYGRDCAECGYFNFLNTAKNRCVGCKTGCDECKYGNGECTKCHDGDASIFNTYTLTGEGECKCTYGELFEYECKCNEKDHYIDSVSKDCTLCDDCARNYTNCKNVKVRPHYFDVDDLNCPEPCFIGCEECSGEKRTDCLPKSPINRLCRNDLGWEAVSVMENGAAVDRCYCVCHAYEELDVSTGKPNCKCEENREFKDICEGAATACDEATKLYATQCVCKAGYVEGERTADGKVP